MKSAPGHVVTTTTINNVAKPGNSDVRPEPGQSQRFIKTNQTSVELEFRDEGTEKTGLAGVT